MARERYRSKKVQIKMSDAEFNMLEKISSELNLSKSEVLRTGLRALRLSSYGNIFNHESRESVWNDEPDHFF